MHEDNSPKPVYDALMERIHGAWETHATVTTDSEGNAVLTGTKGDYRLTIGDRSVDISLLQDGEQTVTLD